MSRETGPRLIGRYEVHGAIASGGMALVHMGRLRGAQGFSKPVAIKRLHSQYANDPEFVQSLLEEARLSERIRHPNVVPTLDVIAEDGELLLVMEYVHGETLAKLLRACAERGSPCPPAIAAAIAHDVLLGLDAAYRTLDAHGSPLHVVHRDISPQNVLVGADGSARLLDFGIAKAVGTLSTTREGHVRGKVPYMAPEQLQFKPATHQTDVYALAVVLWETLCAQRLFRGGSDLEVWGQVLSAEIRRPSDVLGEPVALDAVVMRGLARDPARRYATALEMAQDIERTARLASPTDVANWVATLARTPLADRSAMLRAVETAPPIITSRGIADPMLATGDRRPGSLTPSPTEAPGQYARPKSRGPAIVAALGLLLLGIGAGALGFQRWRARVPPTSGTSAAPVLAASGPPTTPAASAHIPAGPTPEASAAALASAAPAPAPAPSAAVAASPPGGARRPPGGKRPGGTGATGTTGAGSSGGPTEPPPASTATGGGPKPGADPCDPPFYVDEAGRKHFKLACVAGQ